jgi:hypothetical protein
MPATGHKHGWKPKKRIRHFKDCRSAGEHARREADEGRDWGVTDWVDTPSLHDFKVTRNEDGSYTASVRVAHRIDQKKSTVVVTQATWDNMSAEDKHASQQAYDDLKAHEEGHMQVVEDATEQWNSSSTPITAKGDTPQAATDAAQEAVKGEADSYKKAMDSRTEEYDSATSHGLHQSAGPGHVDANGKADPLPGGNDVVLHCPGRG